MRSDLKQIEDKASRIFEYAKTLDELERQWSHLKNQEDYPATWKLPPALGEPIGNLYAGGRQDAINVKNWFLELDDPSQKPTLSSFVDTTLPALKRTIDETKIRLELAEIAHDKLDSKFWSVSQMIQLTIRQSDIISAAIRTLESMKNTNLYREEQGETVMLDKPSITINTNSYNTHSIIQSPNSTLSFNNENINIFANLKIKIHELTIEDEQKRALSESVELMESTHGTSKFISAYQKFMSVAADHFDVFGPFLPALAQLLA